MQNRINAPKPQRIEIESKPRDYYSSIKSLKEYIEKEKIPYKYEFDIAPGSQIGYTSVNFDKLKSVWTIFFLDLL